MPPYRKVASVQAKRHIAHPNYPGFKSEGIYYEEVVTTAGFGRAYSIVYHLRPPTRVRKVEAPRLRWRNIIGADAEVVRRLRGTKVSIFADAP